MEESIRTTEESDKVRPWCGQPSDRGRLKDQIRSDRLFLAVMFKRDVVDETEST